MLLFIILVLVLSIPSIQNRLGGYLTKRLNTEYNTNINVGKLGLEFNGDVALKEILIKDYKKDTLINVGELNTSILNFKNLIDSNLNFGDIDLDQVIFNLKTYKGEKDTNLDVFVARFDSDKPNKKSDFFMSSSNISITNGTFKMLNENKSNPNVLLFDDVNIEGTNFFVRGADVDATINKLSFTDKRGVTVKHMSTDFKYTRQNMVFKDLIVKTNRSSLKGDVNFYYQRKDLADFVNKVNIKARFKDANIALDELNVFYNEFGANQRARFNANVSGTVNDLKFKNLNLKTSNNTEIHGDLSFKNLLNSEPDNFVMAGVFDDLTSNYTDLKELLPNVLGASIPSIFDKLGDFNINGTTNITTHKISADLNIETQLGFAKSNLNIYNVNDIDEATYVGTVIFDDFNVGAFLEDPKLGKISANLAVDGKGFKKENLRSQVKGDVFSIHYNDYDYENIIVNGDYKQNVFSGKLNAKDKNLKIDFNGLADFSNTINDFDFKANVTHLDLKALNFYNRDDISLFKGIVEMKMKGTSLDDAVGNISFKKTNYKNENDNYYFDDFKITSKFKGQERFIDINSPDIVKGSINGSFKFNDVVKLFHNSIESIYTKQPTYVIATDQYINFNFKIYNKIVEVFYPELKLGKNTFIKGRVQTDQEKFKLTFKSPKIELLDNFASKIEVQVDNKNPLFNTYIEIDSLDTKYYDLSKFNLINVTLNDTLYMRSEFKGGKNSRDDYDLSFYHTINEKNQSVVGFKKSTVVFKDNKWVVNREGDQYNKVAFDRGFKNFNIEQLVMNNKDEQISLEGVLNGNTYKDLKLNFNNVDLTKITPSVNNLDLKGNVNGKLDLLQKNGSYLPNSTVTIDGLEINKQYLGNFDAKITGNKSLTKYTVDAKIKNDETNSFQATGDIDVTRNKSYIDVDLKFKDFGLDLLTSFLDPVLNRIRGDVNGLVKLQGDLAKPSFNGDFLIDRGGLNVPYLNVDFNFQDKASVTLRNQSFIFNGVNITDSKHYTTGVLDGSINHNNFSNWNLDLDINTDRLLVLDTKFTEESLYYGKGFIGGNARIFGPTDALRISAIAETKQGTEFFIPLNDVESFGDNSFIHFLSPEEKEAKYSGKSLVIDKVSGVELDFDLNVTEDAEITIVMDRASGSSIRGRGNGGLLFNINTNGKFEMFGDFIVHEGVYNFLYSGVVQKEFEVKPFESTLAWNGDPLDAAINIQALYKLRTNPSPLLDNPIAQSIPVELAINLTGQLEKPEPEFQFNFPNLSSTIKSELNYRLDSKEDIDNQALFVLATGSFNRQNRDINITGTITERLNGLINGFFSDDDSKINIGINYEAGQNRPDLVTEDRLGVTLQTKITDRVLINGKVGVPIGGADGATESVIAGDVQIDFLLNKDGTLTATVFNRENSIRNFGEEIGYTQGLGLNYDVDFDTFSELLRKVFKKKDVKVLEEDPKVQEKENPLPDGIGLKRK